MNKCKDDLAYSANHVYREGYDDGFMDGYEEAYEKGYDESLDNIILKLKFHKIDCTSFNIKPSYEWVIEYLEGLKNERSKN